ncbi:hypothetical protein RugamoR57_03580 [Duganella caerulea]|uniref:hypothetical protein n=1 Tax=Duganella caerulea TaxID=2885762 RepID=UPI0030E8C241
MNAITVTLAPTELERQVKTFSAVNNRKNPLTNLWFFDSPKTEKRLSIATDPLFMHVVLLEGDQSVIGYAVKDANAAGHEDDLLPSLRVYYQDKRVQWWDVKWSDRAGRSDDAAALSKRHRAMEESAYASGATFHVKTEKDLRGNEILFDNWLNLCASITRCRSVSIAREAVAIKNAFLSAASLRYADLVALPETDPAHIFALVAQALQRGDLRADLENELFGPQTVLRRAYA